MPGFELVRHRLNRAVEGEGSLLSAVFLLLSVDSLLRASQGWVGIIPLAAPCGHLAPLRRVVSEMAKPYSGLSLLLSILDFLRQWQPYVTIINQELSRSSNCKPEGKSSKVKVI